jgi:hypothetical protein
MISCHIQPADLLSETILGLPLLPWVYNPSGTRKKIQTCPEMFGLDKVTDKVEIGPQDSYLVFPRRFDVDDDTTVECDDQVWGDRVSLAYYLNFHILGKGGWGERAFCVEVDKSGKWRPGRFLDLSRRKGRGTPTEVFIPLTALRIQYGGDDVEAADTRDINLEADIRGEPADFVWEIKPNQVNAEHFLRGRAIWKEIFNKEFAPAWRKYAYSQFFTLALLPSQCRQRLGAQPDSVCCQPYFLLWPNSSIGETGCDKPLA